MKVIQGTPALSQDPRAFAESQGWGTWLGLEGGAERDGRAVGALPGTLWVCPRRSPLSRIPGWELVAVQSLSHVRLFETPMDCITPGSSVLHCLPGCWNNF